MITPQEFRRVFDTYRWSVFRMETLQTYAEPDEAALLAAFSSGLRRPPVDPGKQEWLQAVRAARRSGRSVQRVHVVQEPLSEYLHYELSWSYAPNVSAGEDIRIVSLPADAVWPVDLPCLDFWLFDNSSLYLQHYDHAGTWLGVEHVQDPDRIVTACRWREAALHLGVPWQRYIAANAHLTEALRRAS